MEVSVEVDTTVYADAHGVRLAHRYEAPPCTGCPSYDRCAQMGIACNAWHQYAKKGWWIDTSIGSIPLQVKMRRA